MPFILDSASATVTLAKLQNPIRQSFESVNNDLKEVYKGLGNYSKALDRVRVPILNMDFTVLIPGNLEIQRQTTTDHGI